MTLKAALQADLSAKNMNLGDLAEQLGITQQSVSKWIAKDEIPDDRLPDVLAIVGSPSKTARYVVDRAITRIGEAAGVRPEPAQPPEFAPRQVNRTAATGRPALYAQQRVDPWATKLDEKLRKNVLRTLEINGSLRRFEYLSNRLALVVRPEPTLDPGRLIQAAIPLILLKGRQPDLDCKLVLLPREVMGLPPVPNNQSDAMRRFNTTHAATVKQDLLSLGVSVVEFPTANMLAAMIDAIENPESGALPGPVFSYEDYPDDEFVPAPGETN